MKKRRSILSIFAILLLPVLLFSGCQSYDDDADQLLRAVDVQAEVLENGNIHITERWDITLYDRGRDYSNLFKSFPYSDEQQITDFSVTDNESGAHTDVNLLAVELRLNQLLCLLRNRLQSLDEE